jgi:ubiquinone/menaquinone biosynthesis C-methylase UbiE
MTGEDERTRTVRRLCDGAADIYDETIVPALADAHRVLLGVLDPRVGESVLDLGCGTGRMAELAAGAGAAVSACDLSDAMLTRARRRLSEHAVRIDRMDAQRLDYEAGAFDAVVATFS